MNESPMSPRGRADLEGQLEYERRTKDAALERLQALLAVAKTLKDRVDEQPTKPRGLSQSGQNIDPSLRPPGTSTDGSTESVTPRSRGTQSSAGGWTPGSRPPGAAAAADIERLTKENNDLRERNLKLQSDLEKALKLLKEFRAKKSG